MLLRFLVELIESFEVNTDEVILYQSHNHVVADEYFGTLFR